MLSQADAALLVMDAKKGITKKLKYHIHLAHFLGVSKWLVVLTKMDLIDYDQDRFKQICKDCHHFFKTLNASNRSIKLCEVYSKS